MRIQVLAMTDVLAWVSIILSAVSITLAIIAIIFGWVTFRNANRMQNESSSLLSQVSHKVEVISSRTSRQLDKAWDYVTHSKGEPKEESSEQVKKEIGRMRKQVIDDARKEASLVIEKAGLNRRVAKSTVHELQNLVGKVTEKSIEVSNVRLFLERYGKIEYAIERFAKNMGLEISKDTNLPQLLRIMSERRLMHPLHPRLLADVQKLTEVRNQLIHGQIDLSEKELSEYTRLARNIYGYFLTKSADIKPSDVD